MTVSQPSPAIVPLSDIARIGSEAEALDVARVLARDFAEGASRRDRERQLPFAELDTLSRSGLLAITVPRDYGGIEISASTLAEVTAILSQADGSIGQIPQNHFYILEALRVDGSDEQKRFFYRRVLAGDRFGNALSEIGTKTVGHHKTTITPDGDGFRLNGRKFYSTGVLFAHWVVVFANDPEQRTTMSFVPRGAEGLTLVDDWNGFGQRTTGSGTTIIDNVRVEGTHVVDHQKGFDRPTTIGSVGQIIHAGIDLGIARAAFADVVHFVRERARPWMNAGVERASDDPLTVSLIGDLSIRLDAATAVLAHAGKLVDAARADLTEEKVVAATIAVAGAKVLTTEVAIEATNRLIELAGSQATRADENLDRHWRNARTHTVHDPVRWKYHVVGNWVLNGIAPPRSGAL